MLNRRHAIRRCLLAVGAAALLALFAVPGSAHAGITIGSDLSASDDSSDFCPESVCSYAQSTFPGRDVRAPSDGVIVRWRIRSASPGPVTFIVFGGLTPSTRGTVDAGTMTTSGLDTVETLEARVPIAAGQRIALRQDGSQAFHAVAGAQVSVWDGTRTPGFTPDDTLMDAELLINADIEPDADGDGFGDETQDGCPSHYQQSGPCVFDLGFPRTGVFKAKVGHPFTFSLQLGGGRTGAPNVRLTLNAPRQLQLVTPLDPSAAQCSGWPNLTCPLGTVPALNPLNRSRRLPRQRGVGSDPFPNIRLRATEPGNFQVPLSFTSDATDPNPTNNSGFATVQISPKQGRCVNRFSATRGGDKLVGSFSGDVIAGGAGPDRIDGGRGADCLSGGAGKDRLIGGAGKDRISGGPGPDTIEAFDRSVDTVKCGPGVDRVVANKSDKLSGCEKIRLR